MRGAVIVIASLSFVLWGAAGDAWAWEPATTHAGLTERALLVSRLHRALAVRWGRPLGLLEPIRLRAPSGQNPTRGVLWDRLTDLDPAGGYRPDDGGVQRALGWVVAGSVLAETPPELGRHHFLEPTTGRGLHDQGSGRSFFYALGGAVDGAGGLRGLATGAGFDLTGRSSIEWLTAPDNDLSLDVFYDAMDKAASAATDEERQDALASGLLALGGVLAVLEDAGEPAHVRNDFAGAYLATGGSGGWDRASSFERFVAARWGKAAVPAPERPVVRASVRDYFTAPDGLGLADLVHRRYFSAGTLPEDGFVTETTSAADVRRAARASLRYPRPDVGRLDLGELGRTRYLKDGPRKVLAYERVPGRVRFRIDEAVMESSGRALLPQVGGYAAGLVDHLLRAEVHIESSPGAAEVTLDTDVRQGQVRLYAEDTSGRRRLLGQASIEAPMEAGRKVMSAEVPAGSRRVIAVLRGQDASGPVLAAFDLAQPAP